MEYLYADGSPFPLQMNFIELLRDAIECAVELLAIHRRAQGVRDRAVDAEQRLCRTIEALSQLESQIGHLVDRAPAACERAAARIRDAAAQAVASERSLLEAKVAEEQAGVEREVGSERSRVLSVLERLLRAHDLPDTDAGLDLELPTGGAPYRGRVLLCTPLDVEAVMVVDVPEGHLFGKPLRVKDLLPRLDVELEVAGLLRKSPRPKRIRLDGYFITRLALGPDRSALALRAKPDPDSPGFDLTWTGGERPSVEIKHVLSDGDFAPEPAQYLGPEDVARIESLTAVLRENALELVRYRGRLEEASIEGHAVDADSAGEVARKLIALITPYVREIARHGSARGELALKRDLGGGRREEIYIRKDILAEKIESLAPEVRQAFEPLDLGSSSSYSQSGIITGRHIVPPPLPRVHN